MLISLPGNIQIDKSRCFGLCYAIAGQKYPLNECVQLLL